jgi:hypothetical protein
MDFIIPLSMLVKPFTSQEAPAPVFVDVDALNLVLVHAPEHDALAAL